MSSVASDDVPARQAAFADLVAAVLDLRSPAATEAFDRRLTAAVADGQISEPLARELRWLQRQSVRDIVEHAAQVLPPTLVALERQEQDEDAHRNDAPEGGTRDDTHEGDPSTTRPTPTPDEPKEQSSEESAPSPPVDLAARRLLVAGLRPISDQPFP